MSDKYPQIIGLTGTNGSGKGEAAAFFKRKGYAYYSLSDLLRQELKKKGKKITRNNLIQTGNWLRKKWGADILARKILEKVKGKAVIDSIRNPREVEYLKKQPGFILLAVDAPPEVRYKRVKGRGRKESVSSLEEFLQKENEEMSSDPNAQQLQECLNMADHTIYNHGSLEDFHHKLENLL